MQGQTEELIINSSYRDDEARVLLTQAEIEFIDDEDSENIIHIEADQKRRVERILNDADIKFQWADGFE